jgi:GDP-mannose 6-dehydrogenase
MMPANVSVFGLGYVGCVSAACFAREGHSVIGVDVADSKVALVNRGQATIVEHGITELVNEMVGAGRLRATTDVHAAVLATEISLICVGTPSRANGGLDLRYVTRVAEQIGQALREKSAFHTVVIRSTVLPGTVHDVVIPAVARASGKRHGEGFAVCSNPEFLREGTSIKDFNEPPFTLIGADEERFAAPVAALYAGINAPVHVTAVRVAEMVKYACNCYHGLKVGFANEVGNVCKALGVDSHEVMRIFCEDKKLNISAAYLRPGFAFGGSCLPKDLRAVAHKAKELDIETPILSATLASNRRQIERAFDLVVGAGHKKVGVLGLAFKAGTDDLRESPMVTLIEMLLGKGYDLAIYDRDVSQAQIVGANREYIEREIPHIWSLMQTDLAGIVRDARTVIIGNSSPEFRGIEPQIRGDQMVVDLVRTLKPEKVAGTYIGMCW